MTRAVEVVDASRRPVAVVVVAFAGGLDSLTRRDR